MGFLGAPSVLQFLIGAFVTLFVVVDPVGMGPIFIGLTAGMDPGLRRRIAAEACLVALGVLAGTALQQRLSDQVVARAFVVLLVVSAAILIF